MTNSTPPKDKMAAVEITDIMLSRACSAYVTAQDGGASNREAMRFVLETISQQGADLCALWHARSAG